MGGAPTILGEFGLPFDMNGRRAFRRGDFRAQEKALAAYYDAIDANLLDATIWNYTADNTHQWGDGWNGEDLSVYCAEDGGGRGLRGFVRPYAVATAGRIIEMSFNVKSGEFRFRYEPDRAIKAPTEIFVPKIQYPSGFAPETSGCNVAQRCEDDSGDSFRLELIPEPGAIECALTLRRL